jgi:hypothetical protein
MEAFLVVLILDSFLTKRLAKKSSKKLPDKYHVAYGRLDVEKSFVSTRRNDLHLIKYGLHPVHISLSQFPKTVIFAEEQPNCPSLPFLVPVFLRSGPQYDFEKWEVAC